jgi:hypothetical protein
MQDAIYRSNTDTETNHLTWKTLSLAVGLLPDHVYFNQSESVPTFIDYLLYGELQRYRL